MHSWCASPNTPSPTLSGQLREASLRCLGTLGPLELNVPALMPDHWDPDAAAQTCQELCYELLFPKMEEYVNHSE